MDTMANGLLCFKCDFFQTSAQRPEQIYSQPGANVVKSTNATVYLKSYRLDPTKLWPLSDEPQPGQGKR